MAMKSNVSATLMPEPLNESTSTRTPAHSVSSTPPIAPSASWNKCMRFSEYARKNSPRIHALLKRLDALGCSLATPSPIICEDVFQGASLTGAYDSSRRAIVMNPAIPESALTQSEWTRTITHELIHAYDHCRARFDVSNCEHVACTEIRAANLSGDCDFTVDLTRGGLQSFRIRGHQQQCVRRRAQLSLAAHPACAAAARVTVDDVWQPCYDDTTPFPTN